MVVMVMAASIESPSSTTSSAVVSASMWHVRIIRMQFLSISLIASSVISARIARVILIGYVSFAFPVAVPCIRELFRNWFGKRFFLFKARQFFHRSGCVVESQSSSECLLAVIVILARHRLEYIRWCTFFKSIESWDLNFFLFWFFWLFDS